MTIVREGTKDNSLTGFNPLDYLGGVTRYCSTDSGMRIDPDGAWLHVLELPTTNWGILVHAADQYILDLEAHEGAEGFSDSTRELGRRYLEAQRLVKRPALTTDKQLTPEAINRLIEGVMGQVLQSVAQEAATQELRRAVLEEVLAVAEQACEEYSTAENVIRAIRRLTQPSDICTCTLDQQCPMHRPRPGTISVAKDGEQPAGMVKCIDPDCPVCGTPKVDITALAGRLTRAAETYSSMLLNPNYRPSRSHIEDMRNLLRQAVAALGTRI